MSKTKVIICSATLVLLAACQPEAHILSCQFTSADDAASQRLALEISADDASRATGLMYRRSMPSNQGMLFIWPTAEVRHMWMKNTYLPLDMAFLKQGRVVGIIENTTPHSTTVLTVPKPADQVLEVNAGRFAAWGVTEGWQLTCPTN